MAATDWRGEGVGVGWAPDSQTRQTQTECWFDNCHQTETVRETHADPQLVWGQTPPRCCGPRYCRSCEVNRCLLSLRNIVFLQHLSCGAIQHNIPQYAQLARALPPIQRHTALSSSNEPIHIKRYNESPVSPTGKKTTGCRSRRGLISPAWHQKFKWATTMLFQISHGSMHSRAGSFVYGGFGVNICVSLWYLGKENRWIHFQRKYW